MSISLDIRLKRASKIYHEGVSNENCTCRGLVKL